MSRSQDTVIDDDEETCPLCIEEFDLSDKNFRPCPCGYQICQFCFNSLKTTYEKSTCPNCRRPYDEKTIQYKIPTAEEFKLDLQNKNKKQAAAKRKETEKREVETSSRRNLAGVRVKQQNLVYVIGLIPQIKDESALLQTLRGPDYFGQYGEIEKIVVSKAKPGAPNQGVGVYVTYARKEDAALCISTVDGSMNGDRILRAQFGTTKYCSAYLRGETCNNKNCSFLHESGEDGQHSSLQNEPHTKAPAKTTTFPQSSSVALPPRPQSTSNSQPMARQSSKEDTIVRQGSTDASALPSTASWATGGISKARRSSHSASAATPSPQITHAAPTLPKPEEQNSKDASSSSASSKIGAVEKQEKVTIPNVAPKMKSSPSPTDPIQAVFDNILRSVSSQHFQFIFSDSCLTEEEKSVIDHLPVMIDPYGGAKRRLMQDKEAAERARLESEAKAKLEAQAKSAAEDALDEENMGAGSLALGGEPEDNPRSSSARAAIQRPSQAATSNFMNEQFANMSLDNRSLTPQQQQQLSLSSGSSTQQAPGLPQPPSQNTAFEMSDFDRRGPQYSAAQYEQISNHQRHGSRYFNTESKGSTSNRYQGQQSFYSGGVQGPPPGLPTAGTPPVSGGGMFAHGQGFTNPGFGTTKDANAELHIRGRSGTNAGSDMSKRGGVEHLADPSIVQARIHQSGSTGQGLFGGNQGGYQQPNLMYGGTGGGVDEKNFPPLPVRSDPQQPGPHSRVSSFHNFNSSTLRSSTPKVPPGFETTHAHPIQPHVNQSLSDTPQLSNPRGSTNSTAPVQPAVPLIPLGQRTSTPKPQAQEVSKHDNSNVNVTESSHGETDLVQSDESENQDKEEIFRSPQLDTAHHGGNELLISKLSSRQKNEPDEAKTLLPNKSQVTETQRQDMNKPGTLDAATPINTTITKPALPLDSDNKSITSAFDSSAITNSLQSGSGPATPSNATSEVSTVSMQRPRTLRVTTSMIQKHEPVPGSATTERSSTVTSSAPVRQTSRQQSISSIPRSRPSTPAASEFLESQDVSRANSPPPSIVGSAPERTKSKNQQKKERREKAKTTDENHENSKANTTGPETEAVGPIVARRKKQKKKTELSVGDESKDDQAVVGKESNKRFSESAFETLEPTAPTKKVTEKTKDIKDVNTIRLTRTPNSHVKTVDFDEGDDQVQDSEIPKVPYTLRDLYNDMSKSGTEVHNPIQKLLGEHTSSISKIISSMIASGDLSKDHPWLHPPSFLSSGYRLPPDGRKGQEYLDANGYSNTDAFGYVYLPQKEKRALYDGHAVSVADSSDRKSDLLRRCLITPNGWVLRHLSADESDKVLDLEQKRAMYVENFSEVGLMRGLGILEQDDFTNLTGGIEELGRHGERHGICWVQGDEQGGGDMEGFDDIDTNGPAGDGLSDETDDLDLDLDRDMEMANGWDTPANAAARQEQSNSQGALGPSSMKIVNLRTLELETLQKRVQAKQREVEAARKEVERMEKAFIKKSKDLGRWRDGLVKG